MNVLAVFAHPDDETMLEGGLLAALAKLGHDVYYLSCTRGEGGEVGDPPICEQSELGVYREAELRSAVKALGGKGVRFLDFVDPLVGEDNQLFSFTEDLTNLSEIILADVKSKKIDVLLSHGSSGEYGHPGHKTVYDAVRLMFDKRDLELYWYTMQANYPNPLKPRVINQDDKANWLLDVSPVKAEKLAAVYAHKTQHTLFKRRKSIELEREVSLEEIMMMEESYCLQNMNGDDPLRRILEPEGYIKES